MTKKRARASNGPDGIIRAAALAAAVAVLAAGAIKAPHWARGLKNWTIQRSVNAALADYSPRPGDAPASIAEYLPEQLPGNAGDDYSAAIRLEPWVNEPPDLLPAQLAAVERGVKKKDCAIFGVSYLPKDLDGDMLLQTTRTVGLIMTGSEHYRARAEAFEKTGDAAAAEAEYAKAIAFSYHLAADWELTTSGLGANKLFSFVLRRQIARVKRGEDAYAEQFRTAKLAKELKAYLASSEEMERIEAAVLNRAELPALRRYVEQPALRRRYCAWALFMAAGWWTDEELAAAEPWPERAALLKLAAASKDRRVAAIGKDFLTILRNDRKRYSRRPAPDRVAYAHKTGAAYAPLRQKN